MNSQFKRGIIELCVLKELIPQDMYGYSIINSLSEHLNVNENTVYPILRRLTKEGYFTTYLKESSSGAPRKYYHITKKGFEHYLDLRDEWDQFIGGVYVILNKGGKRMKKYLKDLEVELKKNKLSEEEIEEILADHQEMIESAIKEGLSDEELEAKFGNPVEVAKELADFSDKDEKEATEPKANGNKLEFNEVNDDYSVNVGLINEDIKVCLHDKDLIVIEWQGKVNLKDYQINYSDNTLNLTRKNEIRLRSYFEGSSKKKFLVYLPKSKKIDDFKVKIINGDGVIKNIFSSEFKIGTNNGDFKIKEVTTGKFNISSVNADLIMESIECNDIKLSQVSGDVDAKNIKVKNDIRLNTVSGDMVIEDCECDNFTIRTVSGDVKAKEFYPKEISLTTVSGDIVILNSLEREMKILSKKSVSGTIKIKVK